MLRNDDETDVTMRGGGRRTAPVTARELARTLGISQSTVSRAFTQDASISPQMRARVVQAADRLGYKPNAIARSLITRRTNIVGIVMANLTNPFYPDVLERLTLRLQAAGRQTLLFNVPPGKDVDDELPLLLQYQVDAVVVTSATVSSEMARTCTERGTPVVLFNRYVPGLAVAAVACDNRAGGRSVADHLIGLGHRRPAFVAGKADTTTNLDRQRGFIERLAELAVPLHAHESCADFTYDAGYAAAARLMRRPDPPDAIFFANDIMAIGGLDALRESGAGVPADVSVMGFDDIPVAAWTSYSLTTMRQPVPEMVDITADLLANAVRGAFPEPAVRFVAATLVERRSTRARLPR
jgi:DNA-binding LacI/PurR family transcriptional regulator